MDLLFTHLTSEVTISDSLFKNENIDRINIGMRKHIFSEDYKDPFYWDADIYFKSNSFSGSKNFKVEGSNGFIEIMKQMETFLKTL